VIVCFVDLSGIDDHHCLEVIVCFVDICGIEPLDSDGHQFHQDQQNKQSPLNSDGHQFHQDQQNRQSPFVLLIFVELMTITV
jgi:hypothetical protein